MVALSTCWYNFARVNSAVRMSPAMACGLEQRLWEIGDIVKLIEGWEADDDWDLALFPIQPCASQRPESDFPNLER